MNDDSKGRTGDNITVMGTEPDIIWNMDDWESPIRV